MLKLDILHHSMFSFSLLANNRGISLTQRRAKRCVGCRLACSVAQSLIWWQRLLTSVKFCQADAVLTALISASGSVVFRPGRGTEVVVSELPEQDRRATSIKSDTCWYSQH